MDDDGLRARTEGRARTGFVNLRSFDEGVVTTLRATIDPVRQTYFLTREALEVETVGFDPPPTSSFFRGNVSGMPGYPGVPVTFAFPEDVLYFYRIPVIVVQREGFDPAMNRWHPGTLQYRTPSRGALPVEYQATVNAPVQNGYDRVEQVDQAAPFDINYTISILARNRGAPGIRDQANRLLDHVIRIYQPYCRVLVKDSIGDTRSYEASQEGVSQLDEIAEVTDRVIGFAVSLRIQGELDLTDPVVRRTVTQRATTTLFTRRRDRYRRR